MGNVGRFSGAKFGIPSSLQPLHVESRVWAPEIGVSGAHMGLAILVGLDFRLRVVGEGGPESRVERLHSQNL